MLGIRDIDREVDRRITERRKVLAAHASRLYDRLDREGYTARYVDGLPWPQVVIVDPYQRCQTMTLSVRGNGGTTYVEWCSAVPRVEPADNLDGVMAMVKTFFPQG